MSEKNGEVYAGPMENENEIEVNIESAPTPKTGDMEGEIYVETIETTETRRSMRPRRALAKGPQGTPKKKKTGGIIAAILVVMLLFGCMGGGGKDNSNSADSTKTNETTAQESATEESKAEPEEATTEEPAEKDEADAQDDDYASWTSEQKHAYNACLSYLEYTAFSKQGLIDQLSSEYGEGYPLEVAEFAVNKIEERGEVDWVEQAKRSAQNYLDFSDFSKQGLIDQLSSEYGEQFTIEQATEAVEAVY